jgi:threonine/homoserine/homoserine lactone efflux protein
MFMILGFAIGFAAAIPLGPVNVFVISQTLKRDFFHGVLAGLTTAFLDLVYCLVALVGFFKIKIDLSPVFMNVMKAIAGVIVLFIAYGLVRESKTFTLPRNGDKVPAASHRPIFGAALLYVSNPTLYMFWFAVAGTMTGHNLVQHNGWTAVAFAAACGVGSLVWYLMLVRFVSRRQSRLHPLKFRKVLFYLGLALSGFGIFTIASIFF